MKTIKLILLLLLMGTTLAAQNTQKDVYFTKNLDAYVGTWVYQSNDTIFKIVLQKGRAETIYSISGGLFGGYFLSVKGAVVENYMAPLPLLWDHSIKPRPYNLYMWASNSSYSMQRVDPDLLSVIFYDQRKKHFGGKGLTGGVIKLLSPDKIRWKLDEKRGIWNETEGDDSISDVKPIGFSIPSDVIMVKEK